MGEPISPGEPIFNTENRGNQGPFLPNQSRRGNSGEAGFTAQNQLGFHRRAHFTQVNMGGNNTRADNTSEMGELMGRNHFTQHLKRD